MKSRITNQYSLVAPLMIIIAIIGFSLSIQRKKIFYLPIGSIGLYLIISKDFNRRKARGMILKKVQSYLKDK